MKEIEVITVKTTVKIPRVPNFLVMSNGKSVPLCAILPTELAKIGELWTEALIERAKEQEKDKAYFYGLSETKCAESEEPK